MSNQSRKCNTQSNGTDKDIVQIYGCNACWARNSTKSIPDPGCDGRSAYQGDYEHAQSSKSLPVVCEKKCKVRIADMTERLEQIAAKIDYYEKIFDERSNLSYEVDRKKPSQESKKAPPDARAVKNEDATNKTTSQTNTENPKEDAEQNTLCIQKSKAVSTEEVKVEVTNATKDSCSRKSKNCTVTNDKEQTKAPVSVRTTPLQTETRCKSSCDSLRDDERSKENRRSCKFDDEIGKNEQDEHPPSPELGQCDPNCKYRTVEVVNNGSDVCRKCCYAPPDTEEDGCGCGGPNHSGGEPKTASQKQIRKCLKCKAHLGAAVEEIRDELDEELCESCLKRILSKLACDDSCGEESEAEDEHDCYYRKEYEKLKRGKSDAGEEQEKKRESGEEPSDDSEKDKRRKSGDEEERDEELSKSSSKRRSSNELEEEPKKSKSNESKKRKCGRRKKDN